MCHFTVYDSSDVTHSCTHAVGVDDDPILVVGPARETRTRTGVDANEGVARAVSSDRRSSRFRPVPSSLTHALIRPESNLDRIGRVERGADETALVSTIRRTRSDPAKEDPTKKDPMATRGSRERKPPAKVRRVDRSRANEKEKGCIERTLRSSVVSCRSRLKTMIWIDLD